MKTIHYQTTTIQFGELTSSTFAEILHAKKYRHSKKIILTDEHVSELWLDFFISTFDALADAEIIQLEAGEENKDLEICTHVWGALSDYHVKRNDLIINIGGGVITDMGGFIAATFKRGIDFINIPTTLLSQVDASIGGKTGINFGEHKNQIGLFADPIAVFIDTNFLSTLAFDELLSGYAEMLKHGLIANKSYWIKLKDLDLNSPATLLETVYTSVGIKKQIVEKDPTEQGERKLLNFGHTVGHAIESYLLKENKHVPHGICVGWGMLTEAYLSVQSAGLSAVEFDEINHLIRSKFPVIDLQHSAIDQIMKFMKNDKKNTSKKINFTLLNEIGVGIIDQTVLLKNIKEALRTTLNLAE